MQKISTNKTTNITRRFKYITYAICVLLAMWVTGLVVYVDHLPKEASNDQLITDGIVIFTGGSMRLEAGIAMLNAGKAGRLFVSGVGQRTSLDLMLILSGKLPDNILELKEKIDLGYEAKNTRGNAIEVAGWVRQNNYKTIRLVTANYHMPRSYFELSNAMKDVIIIKNPVFPEEIKINKWWQHGLTKKIMISEYNKYMARRVAGFFYKGN